MNGLNSLYQFEEIILSLWFFTPSSNNGFTVTKTSAEACCSSASGPLHHSEGLSSAAICASRHNGAFRWRAHQHIHRLIPAIVAIAQDSRFTQAQLSWKAEKGTRRGMVTEKRSMNKEGLKWLQRWRKQKLTISLWEQNEARLLTAGCLFSSCLRW